MLLTSQQQLIERKQSLVDFVDIVNASGNKVFDDDVELAAAGQSEARFLQQIFCFCQGEFQGNGKGDGGYFAGLVVDILADFGEEFPVDVAFL